MEPILELKNICKSFPGVKALEDVSLNLFPGEVHILAGENGAGKSTLMKVLSGVYKPNTGEISINGNTTNIDNPRVAESYGIRMIYQEFNLIPELSVTNNIFLGHEKFKKFLGIMDKKKMEDETAELLENLTIKLNPKKKIKDLGVGQQQMVEIAKALSVDAKIMVFDEPTSSLTNVEIKELFRLINFLKEKGVGIFYISHRLEENFEIGDRVTIMRDGKIIDTKAVNDITMDEMIEKIANRSINDLYPRTSREIGDDIVLETHNLCGRKFNNVNINVKAGEIVGLSGLVGAGRTELACAIFGVDDYDSGEVLLQGKKVPKNNPQKCVDSGISLVPEDRKHTGLALSLSIKENVMIASLSKYFPRVFIRQSREKSMVQKYVDDLKIATSSIKKITRQLSGGTQQKVVVSKWLLTKAKLFIFDEPTRGIDVGAKTEIYKIMNELAAKGAAILMISSDLPEILGMSDRIYVMSHGNIVGELESSKTNQTEILKYAFAQMN